MLLVRPSEDQAVIYITTKYEALKKPSLVTQATSTLACYTTLFIPYINRLIVLVIVWYKVAYIDVRG